MLILAPNFRGHARNCGPCCFGPLVRKHIIKGINDEVKPFISRPESKKLEENGLGILTIFFKNKTE
jgi:hypothetical protein